MVERVAVSVQEHLVVNLLQLVHTVEHFLERRAGHGSQHVTLRHEMVRAADVERDDLAVKAHHVLDLVLLFFPLLSLFHNERLLLLQLDLHLAVESFEVVVIRDELHAQPLELVGLVRELIGDARNVLLESHLEVFDALAPYRLDVTDAANVVDVYDVWQLRLEVHRV